MAGLLRSARPCIAALLAVALVLGINGFEGAIHSAHHLPASVETHAHDSQDPAPASAPDKTCPMAAAALHLAATAVEALPVLAPSPVDTELIAPEPQDAPRSAWRGPGSGRAPPFVRSLPS